MTCVPEKPLKEGVLELTQSSKPLIGHYANRKLLQRDDSVWVGVLWLPGEDKMEYFHRTDGSSSLTAHNAACN